MENADIRQNEYHQTSPLSTTGIPTKYHRNRKIMCCVLLTSNAKVYMFNKWSNQKILQQVQNNKYVFYKDF